jgi:hypothetical protein
LDAPSAQEGNQSDQIWIGGETKLRKRRAWLELINISSSRRMPHAPSNPRSSRRLQMSGSHSHHKSPNVWRHKCECHTLSLRGLL